MNPAIPIANVVAANGAPAEALRMTEAGFRELYALHARPLKAYLSRLTGNAALAEDLMQESFYRMMRAEMPPMDEAQRKSYLYRTATNLARDHFRGRKFEPAPLDERIATRAQAGSGAAGIQLSADIEKVFHGIKPNERALMWMAYVEGASHREIAAVTGLKEASIRPLLFRVKQKLAALLRERGFRQETGR